MLEGDDMSPLQVRAVSVIHVLGPIHIGDIVLVQQYASPMGHNSTCIQCITVAWIPGAPCHGLLVNSYPYGEDGSDLPY